VTGQVRVAVIGCGAIGSLYAAHLARVPGVGQALLQPSYLACQCRYSCLS